jgi:hypothetical protein
MASPARKKTPKHGSRSRRAAEKTRAPSHSPVDPASLPKRGPTGEIRIEAGPAFGPATRLRVRGLNGLAQVVAQEKEKVSLTLDKPLVDEIRAQFGGRALSTSINGLLYAALAQERLSELVDDMEQEAGSPSSEAYERVLAQWFAED